MDHSGARRFRHGAIAVLLLALSYPVEAQMSYAGEQDALVVSDVVVTGTRVPTAPTRLSAATTVLTQEDMRRTPFQNGTQVDDLLRYIPAVQPSLLSSRYNHPTAQFIGIRGLGTRRALVLLDGVPLNDGFGGWINWGLVPDRIERIEIIPGGGSNLYG
ncbi:MAG: Plug domain-containing protein, partial [Nitrospira sp.]|nr:Plug domain-containing protein [Nitrospira sp.]